MPQPRSVHDSLIEAFDNAPQAKPLFKDHSKPEKGECRYCGIGVLWAYTEQESIYPFELREFQAMSLPARARWRIKRFQKGLIAVQVPDSLHDDQVLLPHFLVCPTEREEPDSEGLRRIWKQHRAECPSTRAEQPE